MVEEFSTGVEEKTDCRDEDENGRRGMRWRGINNIIQDWGWERRKGASDWEPQAPGSPCEGRRSRHILRTEGRSPQKTIFVQEVRKRS